MSFNAATDNTIGQLCSIQYLVKFLYLFKCNILVFELTLVYIWKMRGTIGKGTVKYTDLLNTQISVKVPWSVISLWFSVDSVCYT